MPVFRVQLAAQVQKFQLARLDIDQGYIVKFFAGKNFKNLLPPFFPGNIQGTEDGDYVPAFRILQHLNVGADPDGFLFFIQPLIVQGQVAGAAGKSLQQMLPVKQLLGVPEMTGVRDDGQQVGKQTVGSVRVEHVHDIGGGAMFTGTFIFCEINLERTKGVGISRQ